MCKHEFKADFISLPSETDELYAQIDGLQRHRVQLEAQLAAERKRSQRMEDALREIANSDMFQDQFNSKALYMIRKAKEALKEQSDENSLA